MKRKLNLPRIGKRVAALRQRGIRNAQRVDARTHGWLGVVVGAAQAALRPETGIMAAAIAYYALLSLFPLTLLSIALASLSLGPVIEQSLIIQRLEFVAPALGQLLGDNINAIIKMRGPVTGVALLGLIWSASTVFHTLTFTLSELWGLQHRRALWKRRGLALLFVLVLVGPALFLAAFAGSLMADLRPWLPSSLLWIKGGISLMLALVLDVAAFMTLYILLPHGAATWRELLPGAIGAGLLWELAKKVFLAFVTAYISASNLVYGSVAAIVAFLTWAYLTSLIFLFGAHLTAAFYRRKQHLNTALAPHSVEQIVTQVS
jgi:membrane protein